MLSDMLQRLICARDTNKAFLVKISHCFLQFKQRSPHLALKLLEFSLGSFKTTVTSEDAK